MPRRTALIAVALVCAIGGTGALLEHHSAASDVVDPSVVPWPIGVGARYHPKPASVVVARAGGTTCRRTGTPSLVHLEIFARRQVVVIPAGIGMSGGACGSPMATARPTGVIGVWADNQRVGDFFAVWGQPLSNGRLLSWRGDVLAFVDGRRFRGDVRTIPLTDRAEIVLEVGGALAPHPAFLFSPGEAAAFRPAVS